LELNDLWKVNPNRSARVLNGRMSDSFKKGVDRGEKRPLLGALFDTVKFEFIVGGLCQLGSAVFQTVSPYILRYLIAFAEEAYYAKHDGTPSPPIAHGIGIVIGIFCLQLCSSLCNNHFMYRGQIVGGQVRSALMTAIFDKAMRISGRAKAGGKPPEKPPPDIRPGSPEEIKWYKKMLKRSQKKSGPKRFNAIGEGQGWSNGRIINLMSVDTFRIDQASGMFHMLWTAPIQISITLVLLIINLTYSAVAGFAFLVLTMPILARAIRGLLNRRMGINRITDQRVSLTQEILQSVRFVKFFGWESSFLERIFSIRKREIFSIQKLLATRNAINAISMSLPIFASMIAFVVFSLTNHRLNPAYVFSSLALFNNLRAPLNFLPLVLGQVIDAVSSIRRIQEFLLAEEADDDCEWDYEGKNAITVQNGEFTWERVPTQDPDSGPNKGPGKEPPAFKKKPSKKAAKDAKRKSRDNPVDGAKEENEPEPEPYKIHDINFAVGREELVAVIGSVGVGKTSLLAALAGEMRKTNGRVILGGTRAFCPQYAWIQNQTVRSNIMFDQDFDQDWYDSVVDACALRPDLEMLPAGDMTEIGERGITISGGQKQRLNIARAIYFDADIILLDDPLSAVDAHVGRHIMEHAICGLLKGKCRILVTHQLHVLNRCDRIIWMADGTIKTIDTFDNLMANDEEFQKLMTSTSMGEQENESDEVLNDEVEEEKKVTKITETKGEALMTVEEKGLHGIPGRVYAAYVRAAGGYWVAPWVLILLAATQCSNLATSLWLTWWTDNAFHMKKGEYVSSQKYIFYILTNNTLRLEYTLLWA
jgi:ATP-binding cassette, subfamily C (CFTR/MRP), member 1